MVGDGINDTPALSMADVSISLQDSSDIARELADITLVSNSLNDIVALRMISEGLFKRIHSQYRLIVGLNTSFIVLGALGLLTPQMLAMLHNGSTFLIASRFNTLHYYISKRDIFCFFFFYESMLKL